MNWLHPVLLEADLPAAHGWRADLLAELDAAARSHYMIGA